MKNAAFVSGIAATAAAVCIKNGCRVSGIKNDLKE